MKIVVEELENSFRVKFAYDQKAVALIKTIPGRQFRNDQGKAWLIPKTSAKALQRFVEKFSGEKALKEIQRPYEDASNIFPTCAQTEPWPHQLEGLRYLWNREAALLDLPMGTGGKSRIIVDYVMNKAGVRQVLIVCPLSVVPAWEKQFNTHAGKPVSVTLLHKGSVAEKQAEAEKALRVRREQYATRAAVLVINYESVWREPFGEWALGQDWDLVVYDEAQRVKSAGSRQALFAYQLGAAAPVRVGLSGTPFPHEPIDDCYGVYRALDPTIFGTALTAHRARYAIMGGFENRQIIGRVNQDEMRAKINRIRFHVDVDESKLPPEVHTDIEVELPVDVLRLYRQLATDFYARVQSGEITASNAAVALTRLQQICQGYAPVEDKDGLKEIKTLHHAKDQALEELLDSLLEGEPVVVFYRFKRDAEAIKAVAAKLGRPASELSGSRHELEAWQSGTTAVLACQLRAGSVGIDLTRAHYGVYYSYTFSLEEYEQSIRRLRRPGQQHPVLLYHVIIPHTVDTRIRKALERRQDVINTLLTPPD